MAKDIFYVNNDNNNPLIKVDDEGGVYIKQDPNNLIKLQNGLITGISLDSTTNEFIITGINVGSSGSRISIPKANDDRFGGVKSSKTGTVENRDYNVEVNEDGTMKVNVPWTSMNKDEVLPLYASPAKQLFPDLVESVGESTYIYLETIPQGIYTNPGGFNDINGNYSLPDSPSFTNVTAGKMAGGGTLIVLNQPAKYKRFIYFGGDNRIWSAFIINTAQKGTITRDSWKVFSPDNELSKEWVGTQDEYDALGDYDNNTKYFIVEEIIDDDDD